MEQLMPDCDAFWHVRNLGGPDYAVGDEQRVRDHLGKFGFQGDLAFEGPWRDSRGGEKARLTLGPSWWRGGRIFCCSMNRPIN